MKYQNKDTWFEIKSQEARQEAKYKLLVSCLIVAVLVLIVLWSSLG